ncbi:unnamed protein product [marine sediment metagenome]|uniref:ATPase BadF/BadG/BcrA/BcrD type domain-containing protein n=1 Tax=marine sediment metagenome TaxID=412755 RepID=X1SIQ6_9ZZZZ
MKYYLGIDVGSVSVKFALLRGDELVGKAYLKNSGLIATVQEGLRQLPKVKVDGVGVTGSGREFVKALVGADYTNTEIMAHVVACLKEYPDVRTILDIGGEDSKLMLVRDTILSDFQMNYDCGGGTGSMIEAISSRFGVKIEDVGRIALQSKDPAILPGKCGIFCSSAAVSQLSKGRPTSDILMGVCEALVGNYLAVLAKGKKLVPPIVFQGAVAQNQAIVKCFEDALGYRVLVPENCAYMGAIGMVILIKENMNGRATKFRGDAILESNHRTEIAHCQDCENNCELLKLYCDGQLLSCSGSRCEKHNR